MDKYEKWESFFALEDSGDEKALCFAAKDHGCGRAHAVEFFADMDAMSGDDLTEMMELAAKNDVERRYIVS